jgi:hypothetical protein
VTSTGLTCQVSYLASAAEENDVSRALAQKRRRSAGYLAGCDCALSLMEQCDPRLRPIAGSVAKLLAVRNDPCRNSIFGHAGTFEVLPSAKDERLNNASDKLSLFHH